jgi:hypothetical protein
MMARDSNVNDTSLGFGDVEVWLDFLHLHHSDSSVKLEAVYEFSI